MIWFFDVCIADYTVTETTAPAGYSLPESDDELAKSCIVEEPEMACSVTFVDPLGELHIDKEDEAGQAVPGATFDMTVLV